LHVHCRHEKIAWQHRFSRRAVSKEDLMNALTKAALVTFATLGLTAQANATMPTQPIGTFGGEIIQVYGGCGPYGHRGPYGGCRTGGQWGGYVPGRSCPPGFHIGPYGRRCWPNRY
jgi:hypothetical protein